jgi:hypothetical protein
MMPGAALLVALFSQTAGTGAVGSSPTKLRLDVRAPGGCTSRGDLAERIAARSPRIEVVDESSVFAQVVFTSPRAGSVIAEIVLGRVGSDQTPRRVAARSCADAADGAALIIAVTLDPKAVTTPEPPRAPAPAPPPPAPPVAVLREPQQPPSPRPPSRRELSATLAGQTIFGAAPAVLPGASLYVMVALDREGPLAPALFLGVTHVWRSELAEAGAAASFTLDSVSVDACPLALRRGLLAVRPCASGLVGRLATQGSNTQNEAGAARPFGAAGAALAVSFGARLQLFVRLGLGATLIRDSYTFGNDVFYRAAPLTFSASMGVGVAR